MFTGWKRRVLYCGDFWQPFQSCNHSLNTMGGGKHRGIYLCALLGVTVGKDSFGMMLLRYCDFTSVFSVIERSSWFPCMWLSGKQILSLTTTPSGQRCRAHRMQFTLFIQGFYDVSVAELDLVFTVSRTFLQEGGAVFFIWKM